MLDARRSPDDWGPSGIPMSGLGWNSSASPFGPLVIPTLKHARRWRGSAVMDRRRKRSWPQMPKRPRTTTTYSANKAKSSTSKANSPPATRPAASKNCNQSGSVLADRHNPRTLRSHDPEVTVGAGTDRQIWAVRSSSTADQPSAAHEAIRSPRSLCVVPPDRQRPRIRRSSSCWSGRCTRPLGHSLLDAGTPY
jgi:hypothetical protein